MQFVLDPKHVCETPNMDYMNCMSLPVDLI